VLTVVSGVDYFVRAWRRLEGPLPPEEERGSEAANEE
jgi:hypothetical protein